MTTVKMNNKHGINKRALLYGEPFDMGQGPFFVIYGINDVRGRILSQGRVKYHHNKESGGKANGADI